MPILPYYRVDVFTDQPFGGNPLAVFPDPTGIDTDTMQDIAREMNLSETVFVLPPTDPEAVRRLRIFTVDREVPMAGHPTVGAFHVLGTTGALTLQEGTNTVLAELGAGTLPVDILVEQEQVRAVVMTQALPQFGTTVHDRNLLARALGLPEAKLEVGDLPAQVVNTGIPWLLVPVLDLPSLRSLQPDFGACRELADAAGTDMIHAFTQETENPECAVRTRHVWFGTVTPGEDPVTGSACGCIGAYLVQNEVLLALPKAEAIIEQGAEVGRPGKVTVIVTKEGGQISRVQVGGMQSTSEVANWSFDSGRP